MKALKHIASWMIWALLPFPVTFILTLFFRVRYIDIVQSVPFCVFYTIAGIVFTLFYLTMMEDDDFELNFFK